MAILTYHHQLGRQILTGLGCVCVHFSLDGDQPGFRGDWHLGSGGVWPAMINSHTEMLRTKRCGTRSIPKKSKFHRCVLQDPKELHFLQQLKPEQGSKGTGSIRRDPCRSGFGTEKVTENSSAFIFFPEIQPSSVCLAHKEYSAWISFFIQPSRQPSEVSATINLTFQMRKLTKLQVMCPKSFWY